MKKKSLSFVELNMNHVLHQIVPNGGFYSSHFAADNTKAQGNWEGLSNSPEDINH